MSVNAWKTLSKAIRLQPHRPRFQRVPARAFATPVESPSLASLCVSTPSIKTRDDPQLIITTDNDTGPGEEEEFDRFADGKFYPVTIGQIFKDRYRVLGKLGFGFGATVWLARDLSREKYIVLKIQTSDEHRPQVLEIIRRLREVKASSAHPGRHLVCDYLDDFPVTHPNGNVHHCLIQHPMGTDCTSLQMDTLNGQLTAKEIKKILRSLFMALDYLHIECKIIHTDISQHNIYLDNACEEAWSDFSNLQQTQPCHHQNIRGHNVYESRNLIPPDHFNRCVLGCFGQGFFGDKENSDDVHPDAYRSPEVMLNANWSYPSDIWNVGALVWNLLRGRQLFHGRDPILHTYCSRAHLSEVVSFLGLPPVDLLERGRDSRKHFSEKGQWIAEIPLPPSQRFEDLPENLEGGEKPGFLNMMRGMLQWRPEERKTARELLNDVWINSE